MDEEWWGHIQDQLKLHPFPGGILAKAISMTHSGMLYRLDISTSYFYEPLPFQVFFHLDEIYKNVGLPLSNVTYIQYEISFLLKYKLRPFIFKFDLNVKHRSYVFK